MRILIRQGKGNKDQTTYHLIYLEKQIELVEQDIRRRLADKQEALDLLTTIPGVNEQAASIIIAEIGTNMNNFKDDHHLAALHLYIVVDG